jgi:hypothetical protein
MEMKEILDARIVIVSLIFSVFGSALTRLFLIDNSQIGWDVTGFASLLSLIASLLISVLFIKKNKKKIIVRRWVLLALFLASISFYFNRINTVICSERVKVLDSKGNDSSYSIHIIAGKELIDTTDAVLNKVNQSSLRCSLCDSLATHDPTRIWTGRSIKTAESQIVYSYILLVIFLVSFLTHLTEEKMLSKEENKLQEKTT